MLDRYTNIIPFDYNRVKLGANGSGPYINASFVESASGETGGVPYIVMFWNVSLHGQVSSPTGPSLLLKVL